MIDALSHYRPFGLSRSLLPWLSCDSPPNWKKVAHFALALLGIIPAAALDLLLLPIYSIARRHIPPPHLPAPQPLARPLMEYRTPSLFLKEAIDTALNRLDTPRCRDALQLLQYHGVHVDGRDPDIEIFTWSAACAVCHALVLTDQYPDFAPPPFLFRVNALARRFRFLSEADKATVITIIEASRDVSRAPPPIQAMARAIRAQAYHIQYNPEFIGAYRKLYPIV